MATGAEVEIDTGGRSEGIHFTCFTLTKVKILLRLEIDTVGGSAGTQFACFTRTKVQILTQQEERRYSGGYKGVRESTYRGSGGGSRYDDRRGDRSRHQISNFFCCFFISLFCFAGGVRRVQCVACCWSGVRVSACLFFH